MKRRETNKKIINVLFRFATILFSAVFGYLLNLFFTEPRIFWISFGVLLFLAFIILIIYSVFEYKEKQLDILKIIDESVKMKRWIEVIKLAYPISRPLLLSDRHELRYYLGQQVYKAASALSSRPETINIDNKEISIIEIRANVLINDMGWSFFKMDPSKNYLSAISNIELGIQEAELINSTQKKYELKLKGLRHKLVINRERGEEESVKQLIKDLEQELESDEFKKLIESEKEKIKVGIDYAIGLCNVLYFIKSYESDKDKYLITAKEYAEKCNSYYTEKNDNENKCKVYVLNGKIKLAKNQQEDIIEALSIFYDGIYLCSAQVRRDYYADLSILYVEAIKRLIKLNLPNIELINEHIERAENIKNEMKNENKIRENEYNQKLKQVKRLKFIMMINLKIRQFIQRK
jgi:hypothetical protein